MVACVKIGTLYARVPREGPFNYHERLEVTVLSKRAEVLLKSLVERYIYDGQPVGSRILSKRSGLELSPATVRNVMADLEDLGLVQSPHTSSGRVPTQKGYRVFIDTLLEVQPLNQDTVSKLSHELSNSDDHMVLLDSASTMLSHITQLASIISVPRRAEGLGFRQIEFLSLSGNRVLVILIAQDGSLQNTIIVTDRSYSSAELVQAANYFNETYTGLSLDEVKLRLVDEMQADTRAMHQTMQMALEMASKVFDQDVVQDELVVKGEANLVGIPDVSDMGTLRRLFDAFTTKRDLVHLLGQTLRSPGVKIFVGSESGYEALEEFSVVAAPYKVKNQIVGTLGVVGPTRMPYEQVIPVVDLTAKLLSGALNLEDPSS